ncbi:MAG: hypothetical protein Q7T66_06495 [Herminiimonas sp.]|uniref:hypothetical protein n=1 Tax=Herminiimonas sp. TaxID=1926289 RepID=UPI00271747DE|nr:hypothetical protein [Herminiimonas sp.]MDO9420293.1 hypothetical protein [Herminiimonas sp.]
MTEAIESFHFKVFSRRRDNYFTYILNNTAEGWHIQHGDIDGNCSRSGVPLFYRAFEQDSVYWPYPFGRFLEHLWGKLHREDISRDQAQTMLNELSEWVITTERSQPVWAGYNECG